MPSARHTMTTACWYTPPAIVEAAREVMAGIDLDPASDPYGQTLVGAHTFYDEAQDGLRHPWTGRVFLNPPGGRNAHGSLVNQFWARLLQHYLTGRVQQAIWIGYSLEQLQTIQSSDVLGTPLEFPLCIPKRRIAFVSPSGDKSSPSHGNYIAYLGPLRSRFRQVLSQFGVTT